MYRPQVKRMFELGKILQNTKQSLSYRSNPLSEGIPPMTTVKLAISPFFSFKKIIFHLKTTSDLHPDSQGAADALDRFCICRLCGFSSGFPREILVIKFGFAFFLCLSNYLIAIRALYRKWVPKQGFWYILTH